MINVLLVAGAVPTRQAVLAEALEELREHGAAVWLACHFDPEELALKEGLAEAHSLPAAAAKLPARVRGKIKRADSPRRIWLRAQHDSWVRERARRADVLVALDPRAIHTVWQLAHRHRAADAVYGLAPALKAVDARRQDPAKYARLRKLRPGPSPQVFVHGATGWTGDTAKAVGRRLVGRKVLRTAPGRVFWRTAVSAPGVPERLRVKLAQQVRESLLATDQPVAAARTAEAVGRRVSGTAARAEMLGAATMSRLDHGEIPEFFTEAANAELRMADTFYARREIAKSSGALMRAIRMLFHRLVHFDGDSSPIAEDPEGFLGPWHRSQVGKALAAPRGRACPAAPPPADRPLRLLLVTRANDNFLGEIRDRYQHHPGVELRYLDMATDPALDPLTHYPRRLIEQVISGGNDYGQSVEALLRPHLDWADTVFVDWCVITAAMFTVIDPRDTRVVVRLHSFETFSLWPHLVDFSRVDDVVFVSEHLRELTLAAVPRLREPDAPRTHVISNAMDLRRYPREKPAEARFNLGMVGVSSITKDPLWTVEVLRILRERDPRYRLLLIGSEIDPEFSTTAAGYRERFDRTVAQLGSDDVVRRLGQTDDVPGALADVGVIVSSSIRESFHCGLVEGAASGAVPVVRNWPFFAGKRHGAHTLFPDGWVVDTPAQAAERILKLTATEDAWREAGREASEYVQKTWDWTVTQRDFDKLLLAGEADTAG